MVRVVPRVDFAFKKLFGSEEKKFTSSSIRKAVEVLETISLNDEEREVYENRLKWLRDEEMALKTAHHRGKAEGLTLGAQAATIAIARSLKARNIPLEDIVAATGLSAEEIEAM